MAGEQLETVDKTEQNSTGDGASQVDAAAGNKAEDDDLDAGFEAKGAQHAPEKPEGQTDDTAQPAETAGKPEPTSGAAAAPAPEPEYVRVTRADWEALNTRVAGVDDIKRQLSSVNGRIGDFAKRLDGDGQVVEVTADDFPEMKRDFPELVPAQVEAVNNALKKARIAGGGISQEVLEREVQKATETARASAVNLHLDDIVGSDWVTEVKTPEFQAFKASNAEIATLCASPEPRDAAKALRAWMAHKTKPAAAPAPASPKTSARTQQLVAAVTPRGSSAAPAARANDDGFDEGFKTGQA